MKTFRYSLRNQNKIKESLGQDFLKWLLLSLNECFSKDVAPTEYDYDNINLKVIHVNNVQPNTDSFFELYVIKKTYNVYNLAYKSCCG